MIRKNPFKFKLSDGIPNDAHVRSALTKARQERYLQYIRIRKQLCRAADKPYFIAPSQNRQRQPQHPHDRCRLHGLPPHAGKPWSIPRRTGEGNAETILSAGVPKLQLPGMTFCRAKCIADFAPHDSGSRSCFDERWTLLIGKGKQRHSLLLLLRIWKDAGSPRKGWVGHPFICAFCCLLPADGRK